MLFLESMFQSTLTKYVSLLQSIAYLMVCVENNVIVSTALESLKTYVLSELSGIMRVGILSCFSLMVTDVLLNTLSHLPVNVN